MSAYTRRHRQIIEQLIADQDPFNVIKASAAEIPAIILSEAWSPERRKEIFAKAMELGYDPIDHLVVGDYDLTLWHTDKLKENPDAYLVAINNAEHDPFEAAIQQTDYPETAHVMPPIKAIRAKLAEWVGKYGSVIVGSTMSERNEQYLRLCRRILPGYSFVPFFQGNFAHGFRLSK
jgi:hypothetical protein